MQLSFGEICTFANNDIKLTQLINATKKTYKTENKIKNNKIKNAQIQSNIVGHPDSEKRTLSQPDNISDPDGQCVL